MPAAAVGGAATGAGPGGAVATASAAAAAAAATIASELKSIPAGARLLLAEDCLSLVIALLTELPRPAGRASARDALRREVVHRLASSECTHSEVSAVVANLMEVRHFGRVGWGIAEECETCVARCAVCCSVCRCTDSV